MTTSTTPLGLAVLADAYQSPDVTAVDAAARDTAVQLLLTGLRRAHHPEHATWSPFDQVQPQPAPDKVIDGNGDVWSAHGVNCWVMDGYDPDVHEADAGLAWSWRDMVRKFGPVTAVEACPGSTLRVRVIDRGTGPGYEGLTIREVAIAATCPVCGGPRGVDADGVSTVRPHRFCEDGAWYTCDRWTNPCGHIDTYAAVLAWLRTRELDGAR